MKWAQVENQFSFKKKGKTSVHDREIPTLEVMQVDSNESDWRTPIINFIKDPSSKTDRKRKLRSLRYVLCKKSVDGLRLLLKCLGKHESMLLVMAEVHEGIEGICGAHQA